VAVKIDPARLKRFRERSLLTQIELAAKAGMNSGTISRLERGTGACHPQTVRAIAGALSIDPAVLLDDLQEATA
jgi:transcriptional regulator with XRE-family HTH domain